MTWYSAEHLAFRAGLGAEHKLEFRTAFTLQLWSCHGSWMLLETVMIPQSPQSRGPMLSIQNHSNPCQHCFGLGSVTKNADSPCVHRCRTSNAPQDHWPKDQSGESCRQQKVTSHLPVHLLHQSRHTHGTRKAETSSTQSTSGLAGISQVSCYGSGIAASNECNTNSGAFFQVFMSPDRTPDSGFLTEFSQRSYRPQM